MNSVSARVSTRVRACVRVVVLVGLALTLLLSGCGQDQPEPSAQGGPATDQLRLGLTEMNIEDGGVALLPGQVQVEVTNAGGMGHDVVVHGEEGTWATPVLGPGESHEMVITTVAGEQLHLVCTVTGHEAQGMHTRIDVVGDAADEQADTA